MKRRHMVSRQRSGWRDKKMGHPVGELKKEVRRKQKCDIIGSKKRIRG